MGARCAYTKEANMTCKITSEEHKEIVVLKAAVVNAIRKEMSGRGAVESYYNKITGGTGACFFPGTKITVDDGGFKLIENIKEGDFVLTHKGRLRQVKKTMKRMVTEDVYEIKVTGVPDKLRVTKEHPLYLKKMIPKENPKSQTRLEFDQYPQWIKAKNARENDVIHAPTYNPGQTVRGGRFASAACTYSKISNIHTRHYKGIVYNFEVEEDNTYVANSCTVHNCENVPTAFILQNTLELSFLSQTDQLLMEAEILEYNIDGIWTLGRSYRNEPRAGDGRHLAEFALLEYEGRDMNLEELVKFQQALLYVAIEAALESNAVKKEHRERLKKYLKTPATIISYTDILKRLNDGGVSVNWGDDFSSEIEEMVCLLFDGPVQVTNYPESIKFFNMYRADRAELEHDLSIAEYNKRKYTVDCVDFLLPWAGETFGASRREENYDTLTIKLRESHMFAQMAQIRSAQSGYSDDMDIPKHVMDAAWKPFAPYLDLFNPEKHPDRQSVTRSGFGLGMGRLIQFLLGSTSVVVF